MFRKRQASLPGFFATVQVSRRDEWRSGSTGAFLKRGRDGTHVLQQGTFEQTNYTLSTKHHIKNLSIVE